MSDTAVELQIAVLDVLINDAAVSSIVDGRIHDGKPTAYPCITFGPSDFVPDDMVCIEGEVHSLQLDCWVREGTRLNPAKVLAGAVHAALHDAALVLSVNALANLRVTFVRAFMDPDGLTGHGVVTLEAEIERR